MAAKEEECDSVSTIENNDVDVDVENDNNTTSRGRSRNMSIAERRAARCGFNASKMNLIAPDYFTVPPGLSPSALLDSPVMLPNAQAQLSPTTGTFHTPSPNHDTLNGEDATPMDTQTCSPSENKPFEYPRNLLEMRQKECFGDMSSRNQMTFEHEVVMSPNLDRHQHQYQIKSKEANKNLEDGFNWRKYGQKHVKGSEYPRSYYKCTSSNCPVTKKVERSHDGLITEVVYKGSHNHPQPQPQPQPFKCMQEEIGTDAGLMYIKTETKDISSESRPIVCSSFLNEFSHDPTSRSVEAAAADDRNEASSDSVSLNVEDDENGDQCEASQRKRESFPNERCTREPKVVVQIESDIDILDDGYRWRKYGQKVVKGNPNPRSYYKCTTPGCPVRKHVERAAENIKFVVTTYEGKHNHELPSSRSGISEVANQLPPQKPAGEAAGKQQQIQEMYLDRKPVLNYKYNELMRSNLGGRASSLYSLPLPTFHSLPVLNSYHNHPMMPAPDYLAMPSPPIAASSTAATQYHVPHHSHDGSYHSSSSSSSSNHHIRPWTWSRGQEVKHKEDQMKDEDEVLMYDDAILSVPNLQSYGTI